MKFRNQARLCSAVSDFEAHIMPSLCLTFQANYRYGKILTPMWLRRVNFFLMMSKLRYRENTVLHYNEGV